MDESKLPPPATVQIDFTRDIKPILETSCLRCHGPERPKSRFRLDTWEAALKGGANGVDLLPGNSAKSPLIYYTARLVEDMEMPPPGKGEPLTLHQVALLRAWIDQGVAWEAGPTNHFALSLSPTIGATAVRGNTRKFRELYWQKEGLNGGLERFELFENAGPDAKLSLSGHALLDDYKIDLSVDKPDLGFIHSGWEEYRKYFDDTGGYFLASKQKAPGLGEDLHLDLGKAWMDFGLTLPGLPRMVLGYEYGYKVGQESTLISGVSAPSEEDVRERVHLIKFDLDAEAAGVTVEERFRGEYYGLRTQSTNYLAALSRTGPPASALTLEHESQGASYFQGANTIRLERKLNDWLFASAGYLYSKLNADATFSLDTLPLVGPANADQVWRIPQITLEKESHVFNLNSLLGPCGGLSLSMGVQGEWTRQQGFGNGSLNQTAPSLTNRATLGSDYNLGSTEETAALRYTTIPSTVLFADGRWQQQGIGQSDDLAALTDTDKSVFSQRTYSTEKLNDYRFGFNTSPWPRVSWSAHYRRSDDDTQYQNGALHQPAGSQTAYPGFLLERDVRTDGVESKLVLRPSSWFKTTLSYQYLTTDYSTDTGPFTQTGVRPFVPGNITPGGGLLAGREQSKVYSISTTVTPIRRLNLTAAFSDQPTSVFSFQPPSLTAASNGFVAPFRGNIYSVVTSGNYVLGQTANLFASYSFSEANYGQNTLAGGLPAGIEYQQHAARVGLERRFGKNVTAKLQYGYDSYTEPGSGSVNNFTAHSVFGTITCRWP